VISACRDRWEADEPGEHPRRQLLGELPDEVGAPVGGKGVDQRVGVAFAARPQPELVDLGERVVEHGRAPRVLLAARPGQPVAARAEDPCLRPVRRD
jgi:hypothetical protein